MGQSIALILIFSYFLVFFIVGTIIKNNSIVDIGWGLGYVIVAVILLLFDKVINIGQMIITLMVALWGLRLFYYIMKRNWQKPEDFRYQKFRQDWGKNVILRAFFQVYMLQGFFMYIIAQPVIMMYGVNHEPMILLVILGTVIWLFGYYFEVVGDAQLKAFKAKPVIKGNIMQVGLWQYTRHPNYFGEAAMWWGIWLVAFAYKIPFVSVVSPITITVLLLYVSGVPLLEKAMQDRPGYAEYAEKTNVFFPWFKKK